MFFHRKALAAIFCYVGINDIILYILSFLIEYGLKSEDQKYHPLKGDLTEQNPDFDKNEHVWSGRNTTSLFSFTFSCRLWAVRDLLIQPELTFKMSQRGIGQRKCLYTRCSCGPYINTKSCFMLPGNLPPSTKGILFRGMGIVLIFAGLRPCHRITIDSRALRR